MSERKEYLGDGLYVSFDGFGLWLTAEDGVRVTNRVYLEPQVWVALEDYVSRLLEEAARAEGSEP